MASRRISIVVLCVAIAASVCGSERWEEQENPDVQNQELEQVRPFGDVREGHLRRHHYKASNAIPERFPSVEARMRRNQYSGNTFSGRNNADDWDDRPPSRSPGRAAGGKFTDLRTHGSQNSLVDKALAEANSALHESRLADARLDARQNHILAQNEARSTEGWGAVKNFAHGKKDDTELHQKGEVGAPASASAKENESKKKEAKKTKDHVADPNPFGRDGAKEEMRELARGADNKAGHGDDNTLSAGAKLGNSEASVVRVKEVREPEPKKPAPAKKQKKKVPKEEPEHDTGPAHCSNWLNGNQVSSREKTCNMCVTTEISTAGGGIVTSNCDKRRLCDGLQKGYYKILDGDCGELPSDPKGRLNGQKVYCSKANPEGGEIPKTVKCRKITIPKHGETKVADDDDDDEDDEDEDEKEKKEEAKVEKKEEAKVEKKEEAKVEKKEEAKEKKEDEDEDTKKKKPVKKNTKKSEEAKKMKKEEVKVEKKEEAKEIAKKKVLKKDEDDDDDDDDEDDDDDVDDEETDKKSVKKSVKKPVKTEAKEPVAHADVSKEKQKKLAFKASAAAQAAAAAAALARRYGVNPYASPEQAATPLNKPKVKHLNPAAKSAAKKKVLLGVSSNEGKKDEAEEEEGAKKDDSDDEKKDDNDEKKETPKQKAGKKEQAKTEGSDDDGDAEADNEVGKEDKEIAENDTGKPMDEKSADELNIMEKRAKLRILREKASKNTVRKEQEEKRRKKAEMEKKEDIRNNKAVAKKLKTRADLEDEKLSKWRIKTKQDKVELSKKMDEQQKQWADAPVIQRKAEAEVSSVRKQGAGKVSAKVHKRTITSPSKDGNAQCFVMANNFKATDKPIECTAGNTKSCVTSELEGTPEVKEGFRTSSCDDGMLCTGLGKDYWEAIPDGSCATIPGSKQKIYCSKKQPVDGLIPKGVDCPLLVVRKPSSVGKTSFSLWVTGSAVLAAVILGC